jgi:hypothetical protein
VHRDKPCISVVPQKTNKNSCNDSYKCLHLSVTQTHSERVDKMRAYGRVKGVTNCLVFSWQLTNCGAHVLCSVLSSQLHFFKRAEFVEFYYLLFVIPILKFYGPNARINLVCMCKSLNKFLSFFNLYVRRRYEHILFSVKTYNNRY